jgi:hypothetical protein
MTFSESGENRLYIRSMGKLLRVTAIFDTVQAANLHMQRHREQAVVAEIGTVILLADVHDRGLALPQEEGKVSVQYGPASAQPSPSPGVE